jgi:chemotaxis protein CheC
MTAPVVLTDERLHTILQTMARAGIEKAADGLSMMIGQHVTLSVPQVSVVPLISVPERAGGPDALVVGIYLACEGAMSGHIMLIMSHQEALHLVDLLFGVEEGTTTELTSLERSALAEAGNLTASYFLNAVSELLGVPGLPSPPAVIVDMAGAIVDIMLVTAGQMSDDVLLLEAVFRAEDRELNLQFWVLPDILPLYSTVAGNGQA